MATWGLRWQVPFATKDNRYLCVNIYDKGYTGTSAYLTGAADPFVTQENNDNNIFKPIRRQTGYLRIIDKDATLLEEMMPSNNLQRMVKLYAGQWNNNTFVPSGSPMWQGYMAAQAYTQKWENEYDVVEFPVNSMLESLNYVQVPTTIATPMCPLARLLVYAFGGDYGLDAGISEVNIITNINGGMAWLPIIIDINAFYTETEIHNQGESYNLIEGDTMYDALSKILSLFGMTAREDGNKLWLTMYDRYWDVRKSTLSWYDVVSIAAGIPVSTTQTDLTSQAMATALATAGYRDKDSKVSFIPGFNRAKVEFSFDTDGLNYIQLPQTVEDASQVSQYAMNGTLYVQHHEPRVNEIETFDYNVIKEGYYYYEDPETGENYFITINRGFYAASNYNNFKNAFPQSLQTGSDPSVDHDNFIIVGAEPVRWDYKESGSGGLVQLKNGMLMSFSSIDQPIWPIIKNLFSTDHPVYQIQSSFPASVQTTGYIKIANSVQLFSIYSAHLLYELQVGSYYWDGTAWTTTRSQFLVELNTNGKIVGTTPDDVDSGDGLYIPISSNMTGIVTLTIHHDIASDVLFLIMNELTVSFVYKQAVAESERSSNCYIEDIMQMGFSEETEIDLSIGTHNNNIPSVSFLRDSSNAYIENLSYHEDESVVSYRPELNLLDRMAMYYAKIRRTYEATVGDNVLQLMNRIFTHQDRNFFGVDAQHNWRDGNQHIKFIEVTNNNE